MPLRFSTSHELAAHVEEVLGLDSFKNVRDAILDTEIRNMFDRYEDIDEEALDRICRAVWEEVEDADYPF